MTALKLFSKDQPPNDFHEGRLTVTPDLAQRILENQNYAGQRRVRPDHVKSLAATMRRNAFLPGSQIAFARLGGAYHLVNGQHRLRAVLESGVSIEVQLLVVDVERPEDIARVYFSFDRNSTVRSDQDVLSAVNPDEGLLTNTTRRGVWQAVPIIANGFSRPHYSSDEKRRDDDYRLGLCEQWWQYAARYETILNPAPSAVRKRMVSAQPMSVALVLLRWQPDMAAKFFGGIAMDDGLKRNDPRKALLIDIVQRPWSRQSMDGCLSVAYAWNAYFAGRDLSQIKIVSNARFRLDGTPFDGRA